jgi:hypothetical protein
MRTLALSVAEAIGVGATVLVLCGGVAGCCCRPEPVLRAGAQELAETDMTVIGSGFHRDTSSAASRVLLKNGVYHYFSGSWSLMLSVPRKDAQRAIVMLRDLPCCSGVDWAKP